MLTSAPLPDNSKPQSCLQVVQGVYVCALAVAHLQKRRLSRNAVLSNSLFCECPPVGSPRISPRSQRQNDKPLQIKTTFCLLACILYVGYQMTNVYYAKLPQAMPWHVSAPSSRTSICGMGGGGGGAGKCPACHSFNPAPWRQFKGTFNDASYLYQYTDWFTNV